MSQKSRRSARAHLQAIAGELGDVDEYVHQSTPDREAPGWYWAPVRPQRGCSCKHCRAARAKRAIYLGFHSRDATVALALYARDHATLSDDVVRVVNAAAERWVSNAPAAA